MATKQTAKKVGIWISVVFAILSVFGIPVRPEVISVVDIAKEAIEQMETVDAK